MGQRQVAANFVFSWALCTLPCAVLFSFLFVLLYDPVLVYMQLLYCLTHIGYCEGTASGACDLP